MSTRTSQAALNVERIREQFPILHQHVRGRPLVYLDNAATTQKPREVLAAVEGYYLADNANVHRGVHLLSERATRRYEGARERVRRYLNGADAAEVVFTRGATEGINLVAHSWGRRALGPGDEVVITGMEHHSNIVPWQMVCEERGARLLAVDVTDDGELDMAHYRSLLSPRTRMVAVVHVSNTLGTVNPVEEIIDLAHRAGAVTLLDGAQAAPHTRIDVQALCCDFYTFSGHKVYAPTGIGALYGRAELLREMLPYQGGGDMIRSVTLERTVYADIPARFEAGTPNIGGAVGLMAALDFVDGVGIERIAEHEASLLAYAEERLAAVPGLLTVGRAARKAAVVSFVLECAHPHDVGTILDLEGVAVRTGHHCTQPLMERFGVPATARASFAVYNTMQDVDALAAGLLKVVEVLA